jgi:signal transduction histidine kinase/ActR/RegA family two-component response regulator
MCTNTMAVRCSALLLALCLLLGAVPVQAASGQEDARKVVRVGYAYDAVFQVGQSDEEYKTGYSYDYFRDIADIAGWKLEYVYGTWGDIVSKFYAGEVDVMADISMTEDRKADMFFSDLPQGDEKYYIFVPDGSSIDESDLSTLSGKRIGVVAGSMEDKLLEKFKADHDLNMTIVKTDDVQLSVPMVESGELDAFVYIDSLALDGYHITYYLGSMPFYFAVSKAREDVLNDLNAAQARILEDDPDYNKELRAKYFVHNVAAFALSPEEEEWAAAHPTIKIGYLNDAKPFCYSENGEARGFLAEAVKEFESVLPMKSELVGFDRIEDLYAALTSGEVDAIYPVQNDRWFSEKQGIVCSDAPITNRLCLLYSGSYKGSIDEYETFSYNSAIPAQYVWLARNGKLENSREYGTFYDCVKAIQSGEVDGMVCNSADAAYLLKQYPAFDSVQMVELDDEVGYAFGALPQNLPLMRIINRAIRYIPDSAFTDAQNRAIQSSAAVDNRQFIRDNAVVLLAISTVVVAVFVVLLLLILRKNKHLAAAEREAERASRSKTSFLSAMSHDIRTPMNAISGMVEIAIRNADDPEKVSDSLKEIKNASEQLEALVNDVLDISAIESGKLLLRLEDVNIPDIFRRIESVYKPQMDAKNVSGQFSVRDIVSPWVLADEVRLTQIAANLVSNAVKYTPAGGSVLVECRQQASDSGGINTVLRVRDSGIGMTPEFMADMWDSFSRATDTRVNKIQGAGLGLSIVKQLVDMMNGRIEVESEINKGSAFTVTIPLQPVEHIEKVKTSQDWKSDLAGIRVLVAEDNEMNWRITEELLGMHGIKTERAADGKICAELFSSRPAGTYDAILMDMQMPVMNGLEATRVIRASGRPDAKTIPIIAMTANAFTEDVVKCKQAGMNDHLSKPIETEKVLETLEKYTAARKG